MLKIVYGKNFVIKIQVFEWDQRLKKDDRYDLNEFYEKYIYIYQKQ